MIFSLPSLALSLSLSLTQPLSLPLSHEMFVRDEEDETIEGEGGKGERDQESEVNKMAISSRTLFNENEKKKRKSHFVFGRKHFDTNVPFNLIRLLK